MLLQTISSLTESELRSPFLDVFILNVEKWSKSRNIFQDFQIFCDSCWHILERRAWKRDCITKLPSSSVCPAAASSISSRVSCKSWYFINFTYENTCCVINKTRCVHSLCFYFGVTQLSSSFLSWQRWKLQYSSSRRRSIFHYHHKMSFTTMR